jgi:hypothetical protein
MKEAQINMNTKSPYTIKLNNLIDYIKKTHDGADISFKTVPVAVEDCSVTDVHEKHLLLRNHILGSITVAIFMAEHITLGLSFKSPSEYEIDYYDDDVETFRDSQDKNKGRFYALARALAYYEKGLKRMERFATAIDTEEFIKDKKTVIYSAIDKAVTYGPEYKHIKWMRGVTNDRIFV